MEQPFLHYFLTPLHTGNPTGWRGTHEPSMTVSLVVRKHGVGASQLSYWRKPEREGAHRRLCWRTGGAGKYRSFAYKPYFR